MEYRMTIIDSFERRAVGIFCADTTKKLLNKSQLLSSPEDLYVNHYYLKQKKTENVEKEKLGTTKAFEILRNHKFTEIYGKT